MCLGPVGDPLGPGHARAVGAAVEVAVRLDAVADHLHPAEFANGGEGVDGALKAVEGTRLAAGHGHLERLGVPYTGNKRADAQGRCREIEAHESL